MRVVDVRRVEDYEVSHIPSAISIPCDEMDKNLDKLSKDGVTVVYSYSCECSLAARAALTLADYGYPVMLLTGGFKTWTEDFRFVTV